MLELACKTRLESVERLFEETARGPGLRRSGYRARPFQRLDGRAVGYSCGEGGGAPAIGLELVPGFAAEVVGFRRYKGGKDMPARQFDLSPGQKLGPGEENFDAVDEVSDFLLGGHGSGRLCEPLRLARGPSHEHEWADVPADIIEAR
ncbi:hypothetical protein D3C85_970730 [compost metagenome]